jgi:CHAD domain-containing protein
MAFRLPPKKPISSGLRRIAAKELRKARNELRRTSPPGDAAIHEARKRVKKVRAVLELIAADGGESGNAAKRLRAINRRLSELRDADAMIAILTKLRSRNAGLLSEHTFARVRRQLLAHKRAAKAEAERNGAWKRVDDDLWKLGRGARQWHLSHRGLRALTPGLRDTLRRGRKAMARAWKRQRAADFHEWRKQIKALWYELRLVDGRTPRVRRDMAALHRAETSLGDDHNLVVLCAELSKDPSVCGGAADLERVRLASMRYQCGLRKKALEGTRRIFSRKPGAFVKEVKEAWRARRRSGEPGSRRRPRRKAA